MFEIVRDQLNDAGSAAYFEWKLNSEGILEWLEELGVLPTVTSPNPFLADSDEEKHDRWWQEHAEKAAAFERDADERDRIIKLLSIGAALGHLFGHRIFHRPGSSLEIE